MGWIDAKSFQFGIVSPIDASSGQRTGRVIPSGFLITKEIDKSSPKLAQLLVEGTRIPNVQVDIVRKDTGEIYMKYKLENVVINSIDVKSEVIKGDYKRPIEEVTLNYNKITSECVKTQF